MTHRRALLLSKHDNSRIQNHFNKYGANSLAFKVVEFCDRELLIKREQYHIDQLQPFFNIAKTAGATYGLKPWLNKKHTEETRLKIKLTNLQTFAQKPKKEKPTRLTREQNNLRLAAINKTDAGRKRCSDLHKGNQYWLGKKHSKETIEARKGAKNPNSKKIYCIDLDRLFETGKEAAEYFGVGASAITNAMRRGNKIKGQYTLSYAT
jgi:group I intron endonuclease